MPKYSTLLQKNLRAKTGEKVVRGHTLRFKNVFRSTGRKPQQFPQVGNIISFFTGEESPNGPVTSVERREKALKDARASQRANAGILTDKELRAKQLLKIKKKKEEAKQLAAERGIMIKMLRTTYNDKRNPYYVPAYDPSQEATYIDSDKQNGLKPLDEKISTEDLWDLIRKYVSKDEHIKRNFITEEAERVVKDAEFENGPNELETYYSGIDLGKREDGDQIISRPPVEQTSFEPFTGARREEEPHIPAVQSTRQQNTERSREQQSTPRILTPEEIEALYDTEPEAWYAFRFDSKYSPEKFSLGNNRAFQDQLNAQYETEAAKNNPDVELLRKILRHLNKLEDAIAEQLAENNEPAASAAASAASQNGSGVIGGRLIPKISPHRVLRLFEMRRPLTFLPREETATEEVENELNELKQRQQLYSERMKTLRGKTPPKGMVERAYPSKVVPFEYTPINGLTPYAYAPNLKKQRIHHFNI